MVSRLTMSQMSLLSGILNTSKTMSASDRESTKGVKVSSFLRRLR